MSAVKIIISLVVIVILGIIGMKIRDYFWPEKSVEVVEENNGPLSAEAPEPTNKVDGWKDLYSEIGYDWLTPIETDKPTKELPIKGYGTTYRISNTCVQQFKLEDGSVVSFKADVDNRANYLETPTGSGNFSSDPWPKSEHTKTWKKTLSVSFRPLYGQPLDLKVGRTK